MTELNIDSLTSFIAKDGVRRLTFREVEPLLTDRAYKIVRQTTLAKPQLFVSTVWLGIDHNFDRRGPPIIFESMVFDEATGASDLDCRRYATEDQALAGHLEMVAEWAQKRKRLSRRRKKRAARRRPQ